MTVYVKGTQSQAYLGVNADSPPNMLVLKRAPTTADSKNVRIGDFWLNIITQDLYQLTSLAQDVATWIVVATPNIGASFFDADVGTATDLAQHIIMHGGSNINTSGAGNTVTYNLNNTVAVSGSVTAGTGLTATTGGVTATAGDIVATAGNITATVGNISATAGTLSSGGSITAGNGITATNGNIVATTGNISTSAGNISSAGTVTGGAGLRATTGGCTISGGNLLVSTGNITATTGNITATAGSITAGDGATVDGDFIVNSLVGSNVDINSATTAEIAAVGNITLNSAAEVIIQGVTGIVVSNGTQQAALLVGVNSPNGAVSASQGSLFIRTNGTATTTLYVNTDGAMAWTALT